MEAVNAMLVLGARPQIIKSAPFIHLAARDKKINLEIVHTGQHYDYEMTKVFFEEFSLLDPIANLDVGSGTHAQQTAEIMIRLEKILQRREPDLVIVPGDTNSTLAGALTAAKLHIRVAHIEAGARSYDMKMPEEINRRLTDHCSTLFFTPTEDCTRNLIKEGINKTCIHQTGDTMYDVLLQELPRAEKTKILQQLNLTPKTYILLTTHRPENVDNPRNLKNIISAVTKLKPFTTLFLAHPRVHKQLLKFKLYNNIRKQKNIRLTKPLPYHETIQLIKNARLVLTDSGGIQKEAFWLKRPCITLRKNTEWMETIKLGGNHLTGANTQEITKTANKILEDEGQLEKKLEHLTNPFGDGKASQRIVEAIKNY